MSTIQVQEYQHKKPNALLRQGIGKYKHIRGASSDGKDGRCAIGIMLSETGWDGKSPAHATRSYDGMFRKIIRMNDEEKLSLEEISNKLEEMGY